MNNISNEKNSFHVRIELDANEKKMIEYLKNGRKVPSRTFLIPVVKLGNCEALINSDRRDSFEKRIVFSNSR